MLSFTEFLGKYTYELNCEEIGIFKDDIWIYIGCGQILSDVYKFRINSLVVPSVILK